MSSLPLHSLRPPSTTRHLCARCRHFATSSTTLVKRPQKPYPMSVPFVDVHGYSHKLENKLDKKGRLRSFSPSRMHVPEYLNDLAEKQSLSPTERYGSSKGFGLRSSDRKEDLRELGFGRSGKGRPLDLDLKERFKQGRLVIYDQDRSGGLSSMERGGGGFGLRRVDEGVSHRGGGGFGLQARERASGVEEQERIGSLREERFTLRPLESSREERSSPPHSSSANQANSSGAPAARSSTASIGTSDATGFSQRRQTPRDATPLTPRLKDAIPFAPRLRVDVDEDTSVTLRTDIYLGTPRPPSSPDAARSYSIGTRFGQRIDATTNHDSPEEIPTSTRPTNRPPLPLSPLISLSPLFTPSSAPEQADSNEQGKRPWQPTKKLTFAAMAGLKALHGADPEKFTRPVLSERFGISEEAVRRILKSDFRQREADAGEMEVEARPATRGRDRNEGRTLKGTKWDRSNLASESYSPVPAIMRAYVNKPGLGRKSLDPKAKAREATAS